jgi:hypothetical protein
MPTKNFITYGDDIFTQQKERLVNEAKDSGLFDNVTAYGREHIQEFFDLHKPLSVHHTYGWVWKPYIILKELTWNLNVHDILFFVDAGCCMVDKGDFKSVRLDRFDYYIKLINNLVNPVTAFSPWSPGTRYDFNTKNPDYTNNVYHDDVLEKFGLLNNQHFINSPSVEAGCIIVRKTEPSFNFISDWYKKLIENDYELVLKYKVTEQHLLNILMYKNYMTRIEGADFYGEGPFFAARFTDNGQKAGYHLPII